MKGFLSRLFGRTEPALAQAHPRDAAALAAIHVASFNRGWSEPEFEQLLTDRNVIADRAASGRKPVGFIVSRRAADEAEILSVAVARSWQGRGLARKLLRFGQHNRDRHSLKMNLTIREQRLVGHDPAYLILADEVLRGDDPINTLRGLRFARIKADQLSMSHRRIEHTGKQGPLDERNIVKIGALAANV